MELEGIDEKLLTSHLISDGFGKIEPFALFAVVNVAQAEVVLLHHIQLLAHVIQQVLSFIPRLQIYNTPSIIKKSKIRRFIGLERQLKALKTAIHLSQ